IPGTGLSRVSLAQAASQTVGMLEHDGHVFLASLGYSGESGEDQQTSATLADLGIILPPCLGYGCLIPNTRLRYGCLVHLTILAHGTIGEPACLPHISVVTSAHLDHGG